VSGRGRAKSIAEKLADAWTFGKAPGHSTAGLLRDRATLGHPARTHFASSIPFSEVAMKRVLVPALLLLCTGLVRAAGAVPSQSAFENFKQMAGSWSGKSTRGWEESAVYRTIAGGSAVLELSHDAHPEQAMATVFYLDGDELWLQHFCMAKNAPRMKATRIEDGGKKVWFTFVDGVNLPDRAKGHMDSAYFEFRADRTVVTKWTWHQDGKEQWMEDIVLARTAP
jgi:hypothetical protein